MHCIVDVMGRGPGFAADINEEVSILHDMNVVLSTTSLSSDSKTYTFIIVSTFIIRLYYIDVSLACA